MVERINQLIEDKVKSGFKLEFIPDFLLKINYLEQIYPEEFSKVVENLILKLKGIEKKYQDTLSKVKEVTINEEFVVLKTQDSQLSLTLPKIEDLVKLIDQPKYSNLQIAFLFKPENLILLSLEKYFQEIDHELL